MPTRLSALAAGLLATLPFLLTASPGPAQETPQWPNADEPRYPRRDVQRYEQPPRYEDPRYQPQPQPDPPRSVTGRAPVDDAYRPPRTGQGYDAPRGAGEPYPVQTSPPGYTQPYPPPAGQTYGQQPYGQQPPPYSTTQGYGQPYPAPPGQPYGRPYSQPGQPYSEPPPGRDYGQPAPGYDEGPPPDRSYSSREILDTGHGFFGSVSKGLASVVEYAFQKQGRPNGYILGQEAGGAFIAGLRYGEGILYTKDAGTHRVYWQGPSVGWDAGAEGSKVMVLVYNLRGPDEIYQRFGGVDGSAYLVGGAGITFLTSDDIIVAPIRAGVGLRLGANIGYLKYTHRPTWNPF